MPRLLQTGVVGAGYEMGGRRVRRSPSHQRPTPHTFRICVMTLGELFLEAMSTGVITTGEMAWVTARQDQFTRTEGAVAQRLGRLVDEGAIQLGCRMPMARLKV